MTGGYSELYPPDWEGFRDQIVLFDCGIDDEYILSNRFLHRKLNELEIPHFYHEYPGEHTFGYMSQHYMKHLSFHSEAFKLNE